jgi:hypothetical protein
MIPLFTARRLGPHYGIKVNHFNPIKPRATKEETMVNAEILQVAENLVKSTEYSAEHRYWKHGADAAIRCVPVSAWAKVKVITVVNRKTGKTYLRKVYSWSQRLPNGMVTRPEIIARQEFIRRVAKAMETEG